MAQETNATMRQSLRHAWRGTYTIKSKRVYVRGSGPANLTFTEAVPFTAGGKRAQVNSATITRRKLNRVEDEVTLTMRVRVIENPIPVLVLVAGAAAALGFAGWGASDALDSFNRTLNNPLVWALVILGGLWFLGFRPGDLKRVLK